MRSRFCLALAAAGVFVQCHLQAGLYADSVVSYSPGTGFAIDFGTGQGLTNAAAALGEPSRSTPGQFGGPVDPFNPPYLGSQVVSIGAGGSLTVGFSSALLDAASHRFGLDFIIYGNSGFVITNNNFTGGGLTDGSLFGANPGVTRVSVSPDNVNYYALDPKRAPVVDQLFPTDGSGRFDLAVNPALSSGAFAGAGLDGIRSLYDGAGGGAGFDLAWAVDANGQPVALPEVRYIRVEVLSGVAEIDGFSGASVVPEPGPAALLGLSALVVGAWRWSRRTEPAARCERAL